MRSTCNGDDAGANPTRGRFPCYWVQRHAGPAGSIFLIKKGEYSLNSNKWMDKDRKLRAMRRELGDLERQMAVRILVPRDEPFQRGWIRRYVLAKRWEKDGDAPIA